MIQLQSKIFSSLNCREAIYFLYFWHCGAKPRITGFSSPEDGERYVKFLASFNYFQCIWKTCWHFRETEQGKIKRSLKPLDLHVIARFTQSTASWISCSDPYQVDDSSYSIEFTYSWNVYLALCQARGSSSSRNSNTCKNSPGIISWSYRYYYTCLSLQPSNPSCNLLVQWICWELFPWNEWNFHPFIHYNESISIPGAIHPGGL